MKAKDLEEKCRSCTHFCEFEIHKGLGLFSKKYRAWIHDYKGYMMKEDGGLNYHEWHPAFYSVALIGLAYTFTPPINLIFLGLWIQILRRINQDYKAENELMKQVNKNPWYFIGHGALLIIILESQGLSLGLMDMETGVIFETLRLAIGA